MCPFCLATLGLIVAGTASTGGMTVLAVRLSRRNKAKEITATSNEGRNQDVSDDRDSEHRFAR